jgi:hypothetical protein
MFIKMITFFYDKPTKTIYLYNSGIEIARIWEVFKIEKDTKIDKWYFYCTDNNGGIIMGQKMEIKL